MAYEDLQSRLKVFQNGITRLRFLMEQGDKSQGDIEELDAMLSHEETINEGSDLLSDVQTLESEKHRLDDLVSEMRELPNQITLCDDMIESSDDIERGLEMLSDISKQARLIKELQRLSRAGSHLTLTVSNKITEIKVLENAFEDQFPDVCPLCGEDQ